MNKMMTLVGCALSLFATGANAAENKTEGNTPAAAKPNILIAYYSWSGNTQKVAKEIQEKIGGDLFEIKTVEAYPEDYKTTVSQAKKEIAEGYRPKLAAEAGDLSKYDAVFIGSPNWWGTIAPAVSAFLDNTDLNGKTVIPFITHGGGGVQNTVKDLTAQCKGCKVSATPWVGYGSFTIGISGWLKDLGYKK